MSASLRKRLNCCVAAKRSDGPTTDLRSCSRVSLLHDAFEVVILWRDGVWFVEALAGKKLGALFRQVASRHPMIADAEERSL